MEHTDATTEAFLTRRLGMDVDAVEVAGAGAWSSCFGFTTSEGDFVIRFGDRRDDYDKDRKAFDYNSPALPIPEVTVIGEAFGGFYAISTRVPGTPLEQCTAGQWPSLIPPIVELLDAQRTAVIPEGWGGWDETGIGSSKSWRDFLLGRRTQEEREAMEWYQRLAGSNLGTAWFDDGHRMLAGIASDDVPRTLLHSDLTERNVHVLDGQVAGVFDWGVSIYGNPLYELARFEFWEPWLAHLPYAPLRDATIARWTEAGVDLSKREERMVANHLRIGIEHIAYHASIDDLEQAADVAARMKELAA